MLPNNSLGLKVEKKVVNLRVWPNIQGDRAMFREVIRSVPDRYLVEKIFLCRKALSITESKLCKIGHPNQQ